MKYSFFEQILNWSEVWALLIPIALLSKYPKQPSYLKPIIVYVIAALVLNLWIDIIGSFKETLHFPRWLGTNNYLYNVQSILRFICFSLFFNHVLPLFKNFRRVISIVAALFLLVNFIFFENFFRYQS